MALVLASIFQVLSGIGQHVGGTGDPGGLENNATNLLVAAWACLILYGTLGRTDHIFDRPESSHRRAIAS